MPTLREMREALADTVSSAIPELKAYPYLGEVVQVPCFVIGPPVANFAVQVQRGFPTAVMSMGLDGLGEWEFELYELVGVLEMVVAQSELDQYVQAMGPKSIRQAIFEDDTLGDVVDDAMVVTMDSYGSHYEVVKIPHVGARLKIKILATGS